MAKLQSQKYRTCIDAYNECLEACELCAIKCLHDENVKSLTNCVEICATCSHICSFASLAMSAESEYSKKIWIFVPRYVRHVLLNVKNIASIWNIAGYVRNPVVDVHKNVEI
jgi:dissimilatory sulfite reductase (desulfoviridin) alpha/beta subunit